MLFLIQCILLFMMLWLLPLYKNRRLWILHTFIILLPNNTWVESHAMVTTTDIFIIIMGAILLGDYALGSLEPSSRKNSLNKYILLFFTVSIISVLFARFPKQAIWQLWTSIKLLILFFYVQRYLDGLSALSSTARTFVFSGIVPAIYGIITYKKPLISLIQQYKVPQYLRASGSFLGGPVEFTYYIVLMFGLLIALIISRKTLHERILYISIIALYLITLGTTFTRNGYISLVACLLTVIWFQNRGKVLRPLFFIMMGICLILILPLPKLVVSRFLSLFSPTNDVSIMARPMLWKGAIQIFQNHPLVGVGIGNFGMVFRNEGYCPPYFKFTLFSSAHNIIFETLADMGLVGLITLGLIIWNYSRGLLRVYMDAVDKEKKIAILGLIATGVSALIFGLSDFVWINQRSGTITGLILGLMAVSIRIHESKLADSSYKAL